MIDRANVNRALAKAIAYQQCGKGAEARAWGRELVRLLQMADILTGGPPEPSLARDIAPGRLTGRTFATRAYREGAE